MVGMDSDPDSPPEAAAPKSNMRLLRGRRCYFAGRNWFARRCRLARTVRIRCRKKWFVLGRGLHRRHLCNQSLHGSSFDRRRIQTSARRPLWRRTRRQDGLPLDFQMRNFLLNLRLEFVRSPPKLVERLADLAGDLRQLLGPEHDQGQKEQENRLGKAHAIHHTAVAQKRQLRRDRAMTTFFAARPSL